ncbi:MAG TPA: hypothetical protein VM198_12340 [Longimicrobiales bacterium]|nr:hypothetical protein [Longimicrobiales bacterium]
MSRHFLLRASIRWGSLVATAVALVLTAAPLDAQGPGNPPPFDLPPGPPNFHDRGGFPPGPPFGPPAGAFAAPTDSAVAALTVKTFLVSSASPTAGEPPVVGQTPAPSGVAASTGGIVYSIFVPSPHARVALVEDLTERNEGAMNEAARLVLWLETMTTSGEELPGTVMAYNAFIDASSEAFLRAPPTALLSLRAFLSPMIEAAAESMD